LSNLVFGTDKDIEVPVDKAVDESPAKSGPSPADTPDAISRLATQ
jgi:hypothetical protein